MNFLGMRTDIKGSGKIVDLTRPDTTMQRLLPLFLKGATLEQLVGVFKDIDQERGRTSKRPVKIRIYEAVRCFSYVHGYSTESTKDKIKLVV